MVEWGTSPRGATPHSTQNDARKENPDHDKDDKHAQEKPQTGPRTPRGKTRTKGQGGERPRDHGGQAHTPSTTRATNGTASASAGRTTRRTKPKHEHAPAPERSRTTTEAGRTTARTSTTTHEAQDTTEDSKPTHPPTHEGRKQKTRAQKPQTWYNVRTTSRRSNT